MGGAGGMSQEEVSQAIEEALAEKGYATEEYVTDSISEITEIDPTLPA